MLNILLNISKNQYQFHLLLHSQQFKMIDCFNVFEYELAHVEDQEDSSFPALSSVKVTKVNINILDAVSYDDPDNVSEFKNLHVDITNQKILFTKTLQQIVKSINDMMSNFVNVTLLCEDIRFFTEIIPRQCKRRQLAVPYVFMNFLDLKEIVRDSYECTFKRLSQIVEFLKIYPLKQAEKKSQTQLMERILRRVHKDKVILSTSQRFAERCRKQNEEASKKHQIKFKYYKIVGLDYKSFPNKVLNSLAPQVPQNLKEIVFLYDQLRFTGRAFIKIPQDYEPYLLAKNGMYIGTRYIELSENVKEEFQIAKIKNQTLSLEKSPPRMNRDPRQDRGIYKIGGNARRSRSRSPPQRERSRQKKFESFREQQPANQNLFEQKFHPTGATFPGQYGIKIRGLPFAFSQWDVQNIFAPYNIIGGSVKLGLKPGTTLKNGEAVILMRNYNDAQRSLGMNGFRCMGRYLEVFPINKNDYLKYN